MKNLMQGVAVAMLVVTGCGSQNNAALNSHSGTRNAVSAELTDLKLDPGLGVNGAERATVTVDFTKKEVSLFINVCPRGSRCVWPGPTYRAALGPITADSCGVITYKAKTDQRPVDGALTEITVRDYSRILCDRSYPYMTEVELDHAISSRLTPREEKTHSELKGKHILK